MKTQFLAWLVTVIVVVNGKSLVSEVSTDVPETCVNLTFACSDLHIARKCNAVTACIEVWESLKPPTESNNEICDLCKEMVKEARDQLLSNETQEEIKEVFEGSCNLIPIKAIAGECRKVVDELVPDIIEMLASRMDPNMVCTVAGLCNNGILKKLIKTQYTMSKPLEIPLRSSEKCKSCTSGMSFVKKALEIIPEADFASLLLHSCMEEFHGNHAQCAEFVFRLIPVYNHFWKTDAVALCSPLGACTTFLSNVKSDECELCYNFVGAAKLLRKSRGPLLHARSFAVNMCDQITDNQTVRQECRGIIGVNFDRGTHLLWSKDDPKVVCVKACGGEAPKGNAVMSAQYSSAMACDLCEEVVKELESRAADPSFKNEVLNEMKALCNHTGHFAEICNSFMDQYFGEIYDEILDIIEPSQVCHLIKLCSTHNVAAGRMGQKLCRVCQVHNSLTSEIKQKVLNTIKGVVSVPLNQSCTTTFTVLGIKNCEAFMKELIPVVYNFLRVVNPDIICSQMTMCPKTSSFPLVSSGDEMTCEFCEALISYLKTIIDSQTTENEFRTAFQHMCAELKEFSDQCKELVDTYFDQFYDFLKQNLEPHSVCLAMGLCDASTLKGTPMIRLRPAIKTQSLPTVTVLSSKSEQREHMMKVNRAYPVKEEPQVKLIPAEAREIESSVPRGIHVPSSYNTKQAHHIISFDENEERESNSIDSEGQPIQLPIERFGFPSKIQSSEMECSVCKAIVIYMDEILQKNQTEEVIRKALDSVCSIFPSELSDSCQDFINEYTELFVSLILSRADPNMICAVIKACPSALESQLPKELPDVLEKNVNTPQCLICMKVVQYIEQQLGNNRTEEAIKNALEKVCSELPAKYAAECKQFVDEYTDMVIELLTHEVAPAMVCAALGLCPAKNEVKTILPKELLAKLEVTPKCQFCEQIVDYLEIDLADNKTEAAIKNALDHICSKLPQKYLEKCDQFVDQYTDMIINLLTHDVTPDMVCAALGLCTGKNEVKTILPKELPAKLGTTPTCLLCEQVVDYLEKDLADNKTEAAIKQALDRICSKLPQKYLEKCDQFVDQYTDMIINLLTHDVTPAMICSALGVCATENSGGQLECTVCQYVTLFLEQRLMDNATQEEIKKEIEKVCSVMPKTLADNCNAFIEEFGSSLLVLIAQRLDPNVLCVNLKICPGVNKVVEPKAIIQNLKLDTCTTCEMVVNYMDKLLESDNIDTRITTLVEKICKILPLSARDQCTEIIGLYGPYLLQMIGQLADSTAVCQAVDLCSKVTGLHLLGGEKCTYGPSYWCQSMDHANACNAHIYCKQKIWK